jgi:hypothetical protein
MWNLVPPENHELALSTHKLSGARFSFQHTSKIVKKGVMDKTPGQVPSQQIDSALHCVGDQFV